MSSSSDESNSDSEPAGFKMEYRFISMIARGMLGGVMKAKKISNNEIVVVKIHGKAHKRFKAERIKMEIDILKKVAEHPNIVKYNGFLESSKCVYLEIEYIPGGDMYDFMESHNFDPVKESAAKIIAKQIISAVKFCHSLGIAHRDIKLDNIMINGDLVIKLVDFGLAKIFDVNYMEPKEFVGSVDYVAPEIAAKRPYNPFAIDIYSLGVVFHSIIHGEFPFGKEDIENIAKGMTVSRPKPPNFYTVSQQARHMLGHMLSLDWKIRPTIFTLEEYEWFKQ